MSKLNAGAFSFVPGRSFIPPQPSQNPPPPPLERPEQTEVPRPAPTISLNIGGTPSSSTPAPVTPASPVAQPAKPSRKSEESSNIPSQTKKTDTPVSTSTKPSKTFTTERAKTDTNAIAQEVKAVADRAILEDLYGTCKYDSN